MSWKFIFNESPLPKRRGTRIELERASYGETIYNIEMEFYDTIGNPRRYQGFSIACMYFADYDKDSNRIGLKITATANRRDRPVTEMFHIDTDQKILYFPEEYFRKYFFWGTKYKDKKR